MLANCFMWMHVSIIIYPDQHQKLKNGSLFFWSAVWSLLASRKTDTRVNLAEGQRQTLHHVRRVEPSRASWRAAQPAWKYDQKNVLFWIHLQKGEGVAYAARLNPCFMSARHLGAELIGCFSFFFFFSFLHKRWRTLVAAWVDFFFLFIFAYAMARPSLPPAPRLICMFG